MTPHIPITIARQSHRIVALLGAFLVILSVADAKAQELFSVAQNPLTPSQLSALTGGASQAAAQRLSFRKTADGKPEQICVPMQNPLDSQFVVVNTATGNNVVFTPPTNCANGEFRIAPYLIEELRQSTLGQAYSYEVFETDKALNLRSFATIVAPAEAVFVPTFRYGDKSNIQTATPKDRRLVRIDKRVPMYSPAGPETEQTLRDLEQLAEQNSYYVYSLQMPDGSINTFAEEQAPSANDAPSITIANNLQFDVTIENVSAAQEAAIRHAVGIWSSQLYADVSVKCRIRMATMTQTMASCSASYSSITDGGLNSDIVYALNSQYVGYRRETTLYDFTVSLGNTYNF